MELFEPQPKHLGPLHLRAHEYKIIQAFSRRGLTALTRDLAADTGLSSRLVGQALRALEGEWVQRKRVIRVKDTQGWPYQAIEWRLIKTLPDTAPPLIRILESVAHG